MTAKLEFKYAPCGTLGLSGHAKAMEIQGKKAWCIVSIQELKCCKQIINSGELWILQDFKGFTKRKLLKGKCTICGDDVCMQIMTNASTNKTYFNVYTGIEAVKTIYREKKRIITTFPNIKSSALFGFVYGINKEIRNKKGEVTQIRQYSTDFKTNKKILTKTLIKP